MLSTNRFHEQATDRRLFGCNIKLSQVKKFDLTTSTAKIVVPALMESQEMTRIEIPDDFMCRPEMLSEPLQKIISSLNVPCHGTFKELNAELIRIDQPNRASDLRQEIEAFIAGQNNLRWYVPSDKDT